VEKTLLHLEEYASEGLRTLCLAMREVPENEFKEWYDVFNTAQTTVSGNRAEELDKAAELIEHDFTLLGATAIEDKLQEGVPDTIHTLQTAGIKVWVLTGDRQETAINIGMSCKLISEDMTLLIVNEENLEATRSNIQKKLDAINSQRDAGAGGAEMETLALVIDGKSLTYALEKDMDKLFLDLATMCKAVICCRVSPLQKALVVKLVKKHLKSILLAIGDGANDVSMIQAAHIGVGISGVEGLQAARSADVSIAQFRYLRKLLLVHGAWSYHRISKVILYFYYKNTALFITQFWYSFQNAFSGQVIYESWTMSFFNVIFTVLPPFVIGIFDQFINARLLDRYPQLYRLSQKNIFFRTHSFWSWVGNGFYHSLILYFVSEALWLNDGILPNGKIAGHWVWGTSLFTAGLVTVLGKAAIITNIWTKWTILAIPGSLVLWFIFLPAWGTVAPKFGWSIEYVNILPVLFSDPNFYATVLILPFLCLIRDFAWKYAKRMYFPQSYHHVQEIQKYNIQDYRPRYVHFHPTTSLESRLTFVAEWNNSKRPSEKCAKCSACANSAGTLSRKQTRAKLVCCRPTTRRGSAADTAKWPAVADEAGALAVGEVLLLAFVFGIDACMYIYGEKTYLAVSWIYDLCCAAMLGVCYVFLGLLLCLVSSPGPSGIRPTQLGVVTAFLAAWNGYARILMKKSGNCHVV
jgi:phospholipid-transporting ATPase